MAQFRLSLYSIFNVTDELELSQLKIKKVRNQLKIVKESGDKKVEAVQKIKALQLANGQEIKRLAQKISE